MAYKYTERITVGTAPDGRRIRKRIYGNTKTELEANRKKVLLEAEEIRNPSEITLGRYAEKWLSSVKATKSSNTKAMYKYAIDKLAPIAGIKVKDVTRTDLQDIINSHWQQPRACQQLVMTIKAIFKAAAFDGIINYDPSARLEKPRTVKKPRRVFTKAEAAAVLNAELEPMEHIYVSVLYAFGLRPGEACALMPADFNLIRGTLTVSRALSWGSGGVEVKGTKTGNVRTLPVPAGMLPELKSYFASLKSLYLFHKQDGQLLTQSAHTKMWKRIMAQINIALGGTEYIDMTAGITQYTFRRTFATDLYYSGISIKKAAQLMGHSDVKMIMEIYAQLDDEREDLTALKERFPGPSGPEVAQNPDTFPQIPGQVAK